MERTALPQCQPYAESPMLRAINLPQARAPKPASYQHYHSGGSSVSDDELSDPEFGGNYTTSSPKPSPVEYSGIEYQTRVRPFRRTYDTHEPSSPPPYRIQSREHYSHLSVERSGRLGPVEATPRAYIASRTTLQASEPNNRLSLNIRTSREASLSTDEWSANSLSSTIPSAPRVYTAKESCALPEAVTQCPASSHLPELDQQSVAADFQREAALEILAVSSDKGPVVNHYPQPERRHDVEFAIEKANKAFDLANISQASELSSKNVEPVPAASATGSFRLCNGRSKTESILSTGAQGLASGEGQRTVPGYADGNDRRSYNTGNGYTSLFGSSGLPNSSTRQGATAGGDDDGSGPYDGDNPQDTPGTHVSLELEGEKRFPCVFHHPENPQIDSTLECKTPHQYVSHLRLQTKESRKPMANARITNVSPRIVQTSTRFRLEPAITMERADKTRSGRSGKLCSRIARPGEAIPDLEAFALSVSGSTAASFTTPANVSGQGHIRNPSASGSTRHHFSSLRVSGLAPMTPAPVSPNACQRQLETFVSLSLGQLDSPESEGLEMLRDVHAAYVDHDFSALSGHCQSPEEVGNIKGLVSLSKRLWAVVQSPERWSQDYIQKLRVWANMILPQHRTSFSSPVTSPPTREMPPDPESPTAAVVARSKGKHPQAAQIPATQDYAFDSQAFGHASADALVSGHPSNLDFELYEQSTGPGPLSFVDPGQLHRSSCPPGSASYFPFLHPRQSAAAPDALDLQRNAYGKQSNTDSGYGTGGFEDPYGPQH